MSKVDNLWPQDFPKTVRTPLVILKSQCRYLESMTQGVLVGTIKTYIDEDEEVSHKMFLSAPSIQAKIELLEIYHKRDIVYPVVIVDSSSCSDEEEFTSELTKVLSSSHVKSIVSSLLAKVSEQEYLNEQDGNDG